MIGGMIGDCLVLDFFFFFFSPETDFILFKELGTITNDQFP